VDLEPDHPRDGSAEALEGVVVDLIGPTEVVDDLGDRVPAVPRALAVSELQVLDHRSVRVLALGGP